MLQIETNSRPDLRQERLAADVDNLAVELNPGNHYAEDLFEYALVENLGRCTHGNDAAAVHDGDAVAEAQGKR